MSKPKYDTTLNPLIRYTPILTAFEKILYSELAMLSQSKGYSTDTNEYFAKLFSKNKISIARAITGLKTRGFIRVQKITIDGKKVRAIYPLVEVKA
jgi:SOS-response transcriptional repressor LexA